MRYLLGIFACLLAGTGCTTVTKGSFATTDDSVAPGSSITWLGTPSALSPNNSLAVGAPLPMVNVVGLDMREVPLRAAGKVMVIITLPSVDTPVCDVQAHRLGESTELSPDVARIAISEDLPYAQRRFQGASGLLQLSFYSDYFKGNFAAATGLRIARNGLLARSVMVVDPAGILRYLQIVPEITQMPNMDKAFGVANELAASAGMGATASHLKP